MLSVGAIRFEDRLCASKKGGTGPSLCRDSISGGAFFSRRALTIEGSLMNGCVQGHEPTENVL